MTRAAEHRSAGRDVLIAVRRPAWPADDGVGLVEVLIAVFVLGTVLAAFAGVALNSVGSVDNSSQRQTATALTTRSLELARDYDYDTGLAVQSADAPGVTFDPDGGGSMPAEDVVSSSTGQVTGTDHQGVGDRISLLTVVSWVDDADAGDNAAKRVTAVATWQRDGETFQVRQSTVIAAIPRISG